jgi:DNA polymerase III subunit beta
MHLNSALFEWEGTKIRMVTTDGHRLSKLEVESDGTEASASMLVPLKGVLELRRLCDEALGEASGDDAPELALTQSGPNAFFDLAGFHFSVKLVDAQFPPYQQVIPENTDHKMRLPRDAVQDALRAVSLAANDRTGGVKISLSKNAVRFTSESPESGEGFDEVAVDYEGPDVTIGFNARYFIDVLNAIDAEEVVVEVSGELDPALIRPGTESSGEYIAVIMPMRI